MHIAFRDVLHDYIAGSPEHGELFWTNRSQQAITDRLRAAGVAVSPRVVAQLLDEHDFHRRGLCKSLAMGSFAQRDAQFEYIARIKRAYRDAGLPVLSMDTKKRELIGPFDRYGWLYSQVRRRVYDHDFPRFAEGVVIPHGIYDLRHNRGYVLRGTSHATSAFACDSLALWWEHHGRWLYPTVEEILLLCDGGGSNRAHVPVQGGPADAGEPPGQDVSGAALPAVLLDVQPERTPAVPAPEPRLPGDGAEQRGVGPVADEPGRDTDRFAGGGGHPADGVRDGAESGGGSQGELEPASRRLPPPVELSPQASGLMRDGKFTTPPPKQGPCHETEIGKLFRRRSLANERALPSEEGRAQ
jgi:hypothetical protein